MRDCLVEQQVLPIHGEEVMPQEVIEASSNVGKAQATLCGEIDREIP